MKFLKWTLITLLSVGIVLLISIEAYSNYKLGLILPKKETASERYTEVIQDSFWVSYGETGNIEIKPYSLTEFTSRFLFAVAIYKHGNHLNYMPKGSTLAYDLTRKIHLKQKLNMNNWHLDSAIVASWVSKNYSAEEAINLLIELQYFGNNDFGLDKAAMHYFEVSSSNLTLAQIITLVAITHSPSRYADCNNKAMLILRAEYIANKLKQYNSSKYGGFRFELPSFTAKDGLNCQ